MQLTFTDALNRQLADTQPALTTGSMQGHAVTASNYQQLPNSALQDRLLMTQQGNAGYLSDTTKQVLIPGSLITIAAGTPFKITELSDDYRGWIIDYGVYGGELVTSADSRCINDNHELVGPTLELNNICAPDIREMHGEFVTLQPLDAAQHAEDLYFAWSQNRDQRNWTYMPYGPFNALADCQRWLEQQTDSEDPQFYVVIDKQDGKAKGMASYLRIKPVSYSIEVGHIHFSPLLQRTRLSTEAMFLMMQRAFVSGYRRYEWKCDALNAPSRRSAQRLGFRFEGIFRQATVYKQRNRDTAWYAIIDSEWPALEQAFRTWLHDDNFDEQGKQRQALGQLIKQSR